MEFLRNNLAEKKPVVTSVRSECLWGCRLVTTEKTYYSKGSLQSIVQRKIMGWQNVNAKMLGEASLFSTDLVIQIMKQLDHAMWKWAKLSAEDRGGDQASVIDVYWDCIQNHPQGSAIHKTVEWHVQEAINQCAETVARCGKLETLDETANQVFAQEFFNLLPKARAELREYAQFKMN